MRTFMTRLLALATLGLAVSCVNATEEPEDTALACSDGKDNDLDGSADCFDINCIDFPSCTLIENCAGGADEDNDGRFDCDDQDCLDQNPDNSTNEQACAPAFEDCVNTIDDDGDGLIDCLDPGCDADPICPDEICNNNADDDGDGDIDCADIECSSDPSCDLNEVCDNGIDDDNDTQSDCSDADCAAAPNCAVEDCTDGIDNDGDSFADCDDANCITAPSCSPNAICGDGIRNQVSEDCDGADLVGSSCQSLGFQSGTLTCAAGCTFNTNSCVAAPTCGNGAIDAGEACDGSNLGGATCVSRGFDGGTLSCSGSCQFNEAACVNNNEVCNNGADDDGDAAVDCNDPDCVNEPNCQAPAHGTCAAPTVANIGSATGNTTGAGNNQISEGGFFGGGCLVGSGQPEDIYIFTMPNTATQFLAVDVTSVSADLGLYIREASNAAQCNNAANEIGCTDAAAGGGTEHLEGTIAAGTVLHFIVDGCEAGCVPSGNSAGAYTIIVTVQ